MLALLRYTTLRLALFVLCFLALAFLGVDGVFAAIGAVVISAVLSIFLLRKQREALSATIVEKQRGWSKRISDSTTKEDTD